MPVCCCRNPVMVTNPDVRCPNCGWPGGQPGQFCASCGAQLDPVDFSTAGVETGGVPWSVVHVTAGLFLFLGVLIAAAFMADAIGDLLPSQQQAVKTWAGVHLLALGMGAIVWFLGARKASLPLAALGLVPPRAPVRIALLLSGVALAASIVFTFAYGFAVDRLELEFLRPPEIEDDIIFRGVGVLLTLQALSLVTPVSEELLFRGFALRGLLSSIGTGPAVMASALVFAALHLETAAMIPIFFTGLAFGWLYVKTGSVWPCIAAHAGQNTLALLATRYL